MTRKYIYYYGPEFKKNLLKFKGRQINLFIRRNNFLALSLKQRGAYLLTKLVVNKNFPTSRLKRFCMFSGRLRFPLYNFKISRMLIKTYANYNFLVGIRKV
jgi:ribosomal protein S14